MRRCYHSFEPPHVTSPDPFSSRRTSGTRDVVYHRATMSMPLITSPRRERLAAVLDAIVEDQASLGGRANDAIGLFVEHDALAWFGSESVAIAESRQRHIARQRAEKKDLSNIVWPPVIVRDVTRLTWPPAADRVQRLRLRSVDPGEIWEILATRGLIPETWVGSAPPAVVDTIVCLSCGGSGRDGSGERCNDCFGLGDRRSITHHPPDMPSAITLAVDAPTIAVVEELVREIEPPDLGVFPIGWRCISYGEHVRRSREAAQGNYSHESDRVVQARVALHALGVTLGAPDSRTMTWIEVNIPALGQAPNEQPAISPISAASTVVPTTCLSMAPNWRPVDGGSGVNVTPPDVSDQTQKGLMDRIRAWVKKMSEDE
jgi:hypothetical protein